MFQPPEKDGFQLTLVQTLVNYSRRFLDLSAQRELAFKTTPRTWGQIFRLPNPVLVQKRGRIQITHLVLQISILQVLQVLIRPTQLNDTPFRGKDCRGSNFASGSRLALHAEARVEEIKGGSVGVLWCVVLNPHCDSPHSKFSFESKVSYD